MTNEASCGFDYLLITACKNEADNLPELCNSITCQQILPVLWVIVNDGSTDNTSQILNSYADRFSWIKVLNNESSPRDVGLHLSEILRSAFEYGISYCKKNNINYNFLCNVDGDIILPCGFFANLMSEFKKDSSLGIASGGTTHRVNGKLVHAKVSVNEPSGGHMAIKKECYVQVGGYPVSYSSDSVLKAKARLKGWTTKRFEENMALEVRDVYSAEGFWKGALFSGKSNYFLNFNPVHALLKSIKYFKKPPHYIGFAYLLGYFGSFVNRDAQISDDEVRDYFWSKWRHNSDAKT